MKKQKLCAPVTHSAPRCFIRSAFSFLHHTRVLNIGPLRVSACSKAAFWWKAPTTCFRSGSSRRKILPKSRTLTLTLQEKQLRLLQATFAEVRGFFYVLWHCLWQLSIPQRRSWRDLCLDPYQTQTSCNNFSELGCSVRYVGVFLSCFLGALGSISSPSSSFGNLPLIPDGIASLTFSCCDIFIHLTHNPAGRSNQTHQPSRKGSFNLSHFLQIWQKNL